MGDLVHDVIALLLRQLATMVDRQDLTAGDVRDQILVLSQSIGAAGSATCESPSADEAQEPWTQADTVRYLRMGDLTQVGGWLEEGLAALVDRALPVLFVGLGRSLVLPGVWREMGRPTCTSWTSLDHDSEVVSCVRLAMAVECDDLIGIRASTRAWAMGEDGQVDWATSLGEATFGAVLASPSVPGLAALADSWLASDGRLVLLGDTQEYCRPSDRLLPLRLEAAALLPLRPEGSGAAQPLRLEVLHKPGSTASPACCALLPRHVNGDPPQADEVMRCLVSLVSSGDKPSSRVRDLALRIPYEALGETRSAEEREHLAWWSEHSSTPGMLPLSEMAEVLLTDDCPSWYDSSDEATLPADDAWVDQVTTGEEVSLSYNGEYRYIIRGRHDEYIGQVDTFEAEAFLGDNFDGEDYQCYRARVVQVLPNLAGGHRGTLVLRCTAPRYGDGAELVEVLRSADIAANTLQTRWPDRMVKERVVGAPRLRPGDILVNSWASPDDACVIETIDHPTVTTREMTILRPRSGVDPQWLLAYVLSPECRFGTSIVHGGEPLVPFDGGSHTGRLCADLADLRRSFAERRTPRMDPLLLVGSAHGDTVPLWVYGSMLSPLFCDRGAMNSLCDWVALKAEWIRDLRESLEESELPIVRQIVAVLAEMESVNALIEDRRIINRVRSGACCTLEERFDSVAGAIYRLSHPPLRWALGELLSFLRAGLWECEGEGSDWEILRPLRVSLATERVRAKVVNDLTLQVRVNERGDDIPENVELLDVRVYCPGLDVLRNPQWVRQGTSTHEVTLRARFARVGPVRLDVEILCQDAWESGRRYRSIESLYVHVRPSPIPFEALKTNPYRPGQAVSGSGLYGREGDLAFLRCALLEEHPSDRSTRRSTHWQDLRAHEPEKRRALGRRDRTAGGLPGTRRDR